MNPSFVFGVSCLGIVVGYFLRRWRGCSGGHHWGEWEDTPRLKTVPSHDESFADIQRKQVRECEHGCGETQERWRHIGDGYIRADPDDLEALIKREVIGDG